MPAIRDSDELAAPDLDSLIPRAADAAALIAREPAIATSPDSTLAFNPVGDHTIGKRAIQSIIPSYYNLSGPTAGTVVGIVLGSVAGFLLIIWLLFSLANINGAGGATIAGEEEIVVRRRRNSNPQSGRSRRSTRTEVREYSRSPRRRSQTIVEERRPARPRSVVVERRVPGDDVVEVIEEHDEYRSRRGSRRGGGGYG
jgi:hypothetical protein